MHFHRHARCHAPSDGPGRHPLHGFGRRGFGRHGGGRGRMFEQGDLRYVVLRLIADKPAHGYEIIKAVEDRLGGAYAPSPGVVYPTLTYLEELGYIAVQSAEGPRKLYAITDEGRAALDANKPAIDAIFARMEEVNARFGGGPAPRILRAMENLKMALRLRLSRGGLSDAEIGRIVDILDQTAKAVETE
jgi:DNA-binding PadR family transcriptional regulator